MKNVLVIGAGRGQIPVINLCHNYGCYVYVVSPKGEYPGFDIADDCLYTDVRNYDEILSFAKERNITAVLTDQLDVGVYTAAYISEKMGLRGITTSVAKKFTDKYIMRENAEKAGISVPKHVVVNNNSDLNDSVKELSFPLMMKPVDSDASRGVYKVDSVQEIREKISSSLSYSKNGNVILEEFIEGKEYVVEAYTREHIVNNLIVGHREYFDIPNTFIPNATVFCDALSATSILEARLKETNVRLVNAFGLPFGITHAEYIYNEIEDKIYLVEIAARGGGVFISSDLIPLACGIDANDLFVKEVLGIPYMTDLAIKKGASAYFCYLTPEGVVDKIEHTEEINDIDGVYRAFFDNIKLGTSTQSIRDKSSRKGPILVYGKNKAECYNIISKVKKRLDIQIRTSTGMQPIIWN